MKKNAKKKKPGLYVVGSLALAAGVMVVAPKVIDYISNQIETIPPKSPKNDDDWELEIVRKDNPEKENKDGEF